MYAYIPDRVVLAVGALPATGVRIDTGQLVVDLNGSNSGWARACGWYNIDDPSEFDSIRWTEVEKAAAWVVIGAAEATVTQRREFIDDTMVTARATIEAVNYWTTSSIPDHDANPAAWRSHITDQLFAVSGYVKQIQEVFLLLVPTAASAAEGLGLGQVVTGRSETAPESDLSFGMGVVGP